MTLFNLLMLILNCITLINVTILNVLLISICKRSKNVDDKPCVKDDFDVPTDDDLCD